MWMHWTDEAGCTGEDDGPGLFAWTDEENQYLLTNMLRGRALIQDEIPKA